MGLGRLVLGSEDVLGQPWPALQRPRVASGLAPFYRRLPS